MCGTCCRNTPITLLPHEAVILETLGKELGVSVTIEPGFTLVDSKKRIRIALSYVLKPKEGVCPFLDNNRCSIHNLYKPLICRSFPLVPIHVKYFIDTKTLRIVHISRYGLSSICPSVKDMAKEYGNETYSTIPHIFPDEYEAYYIMESLRMSYMHALSRLWQNAVLGLLSYEEKYGDLPLVNAYILLKPFVDSTILMVEDPYYVLTLHKYLRLGAKLEVEKKI
ncbi:MAG TPA: YkgJ family cysteine cluster protein [Ignisphaera sp.]|uniref:YkgJ family cysteine cluster protein n=1 Tax=Ignisphaera aggregans TaxID=334771 RepID=A0A833DTR4_9CREN|nr:YkgJ family cysteine cluster protein [Ignisphaera sp.]HIP57170.1 YkgJ family cysteine cluster protein [Ignisphaera aggregans]